MTFTKRITTAIATGAVLANALAPVALANTYSVTGNGAFSDSNVKVSNESTVKVNQTNDANIVNKVNSNASTGGNSANFNTGGDNVVKSGAATSSTSINNAANLNKASMPGCGACEGGAANVNVSGNGSYSDNTVKLNNDKKVVLNQDNTANVKNYVNADASTGGNDAKFNTGGDTAIIAGPATTIVDLSTMANANVASLGSSNGSAGNSSVTIAGNGAFSDSLVKMSGDSAVILDQDNKANVKNVVNADARTGKNDAGFNTGGDVLVRSGAAQTGVAVDNAVNFNFASVDCGCVLGGGLGVLIDENGAFSVNDVVVNKDHKLVNHQDNDANLWNDIDADAKTGYNESDFGTKGDTLVQAGESLSVTEVSNTGNVNVLNNGVHHNLPELDFDFDLSDLWLSFHGWFNA